MIEISGNTYAARHLFKAFGAKWHAGRQVWQMRNDQEDRCRAILRDLGIERQVNLRFVPDAEESL